MPIRLNLLAEAQAAEEERRRDPVKRTAWVAALIVVLILVWSSSLQLKAILVRSEVNRLEGEINSHTKEYQSVLADQTKAAESKHKLEELRLLSANRLLNGTLLNALQQTTVDNVQLLRVRVDQAYVRFEGVKPHTNSAKALVPGKPPTATERILLTLQGADSSPNPGDQVSKYKARLADNEYFKQALIQTNSISLKSLAPPQILPLTGKPSVMFTLECRYPEKTR